LQKLNRLTLLLTAVLATSVPPSLFAQGGAGSVASRTKLGRIEGDVQYSKLTPDLWHFAGRIKITSQEYDLAAGDIKVFFLPGKAGRSTLDRATADGGPATGGQVDVHIKRPLESQAYEIKSDHAVYTPDDTRPSGGKMVFTGHVIVVTNSGFLAEPSVSTFDTKPVTVLLGQGDDYPQLETGPGHIVLTPAQ
jgi:lipopolysaccharide export system protein LptA